MEENHQMDGSTADRFATDPHELGHAVDALTAMASPFAESWLERVGLLSADVHAPQFRRRHELRVLGRIVIALGWYIAARINSGSMRRAFVREIVPTAADGAMMLVQLVGGNRTEITFRIWPYPHLFSIAYEVVLKFDADGRPTEGAIDELDPRGLVGVPTRSIGELDLDPDVTRLLARDHGTLESFGRLSVVSALELFARGLPSERVGPALTQLRTQLRRRGLDLADSTFDQASALLAGCLRTDSVDDQTDALVRRWTLGGAEIAIGYYPREQQAEPTRPRVAIGGLSGDDAFLDEQALALRELGEDDTA
jgi:hypothetical protein